MQLMGCASRIYYLRMIPSCFVMLILKKIMYIRLVLTCFEAVTSLKVNMSKSEMVLVGEVRSMLVLVDILCCWIGELLMTYLGMPLRASFKSLSISNSIAKKLSIDWLGGRGYICLRGGG